MKKETIKLVEYDTMDEDCNSFHYGQFYFLKFGWFSVKTTNIFNKSNFKCAFYVLLYLQIDFLEYSYL